MLCKDSKDGGGAPAAPAAEPATTSPGPMPNSMNVQGKDIYASEGVGVGPDAQSEQLNTQADGATLMTTAPTLPQDESDETLSASIPAGHPTEVQQDAETEMTAAPTLTQHETREPLDVDELLRMNSESGRDIPTPAEVRNDVDDVDGDTSRMHSDPGEETPMPSAGPPPELRRDVDMPMPASAPTLSQHDAHEPVGVDATLRIPGGEIPMPAGPPAEVQHDADAPAAPSLPQGDLHEPHEPFAVDATLIIPSGPSGETPMPAGPPSDPSEVHRDDRDVEMPAATVPTLPQQEPLDVDATLRTPVGETPMPAHPEGCTPFTTAPALSAVTPPKSEASEGDKKLHCSCPTPARRRQTSTATSSKMKMAVTNLKEYFDFFPNALDAVLADGIIAPELLGDRLDKLSISTAYSGIGGPEAALLTLRHFFAQQGHGVLLKDKGPEIMFQMEIDATCRQELLKYESLGSHNCCLFGDLEHFFRHELEDVVEQLRERPELALEVLSKAVADCDAVGCTSHCYRHQRQCSL